MKKIKITNKNGKNLDFLKSSELSLAAKGLLSMLVNSRFALSKTDNDILRGTLTELEYHGYIECTETKNDSGEKYLVISQKKY